MTMATEQNAREAFAGESQANRKYQAFAEKAESEGYKNISRLFKAAKRQSRKGTRISPASSRLHPKPRPFMPRNS